MLDNLERAIEAAETGGKTEDLLQGVEMTANAFRSKLQEHGVEAIPVLDQPFDPNLHQALGVIAVSDENKDGHVVEEVLRGYKLGDQLLRPAQVRVGKKTVESRKSEAMKTLLTDLLNQIVLTVPMNQDGRLGRAQLSDSGESLPHLLKSRVPF